MLGQGGKVEISVYGCAEALRFLACRNIETTEIVAEIDLLG
jgi:hypothetical protein